jgi:hypothetical protein
MMDIFIDCGSGISGDMTLAALIDLGVPVAWVKEHLSRLPLTGFDITVSTITRNGMAARRAEVRVDDGHPPRNYAAIQSLIMNSPLPDRARQLSMAMFEKIARAEAAVHGCPLAKVHFHELGGVDAIVDMVGTALCAEYLDIRGAAAGLVPLGSGQVQCDHGILPVPAPATLEILKGVPVYGSDLPGELVTPTGAAILTTLAARFGPMPLMTVSAVGYGAGTREIPGRPNLLRIIGGRFGEPVIVEEPEPLAMVEACIDNMNPEIFGYVMEKLFADGALDVFWVPVFMKKNRPATMIQVLCALSRRDIIIGRILSETTTTGARHYPVNRSILPRRIVKVDTIFGPMAAKQITRPDGTMRVAPEYESCRMIAVERNIPILEVYQAVERAADKILPS